MLFYSNKQSIPGSPWFFEESPMKNKIVCFCLAFIALSTASAIECADQNGQDIYSQPEVFTALIEKSETCYEATQLAEACAYGSSMDVMTAGTAYGVCEKELAAQNPSKKITKLLNDMQKECSEKYDKEEGTMYRSMNAFCQLSALEWILNIATAN